MSSITPLTQIPFVYQLPASLDNHTETTLVAIHAEENLLNTALDAVELEGTMLAMAASMMNQEATALTQLKERLESTIKEQMNTIATLHAQIRSLDTNIISQKAQFNTSKAALIQQQNQTFQRRADVTARATRAKAEEAQLNRQFASMKENATKLLDMLGLCTGFSDNFIEVMLYPSWGIQHTYESAFRTDFDEYKKKYDAYQKTNKR